MENNDYLETNIKTSFTKVKKDIDDLKFDLSTMHQELNEIQTTLLTLSKTLSNLNSTLYSLKDNKTKTDRQIINISDRHINQSSNQTLINNKNNNSYLEKQSENKTQSLPKIEKNPNINTFQNSSKIFPQNIPNINYNPLSNLSLDKQTVRQINQTDNTEIKTNTTSSTDKQTDILPFKSLKSPFLYVSTGNKGVQTDKQTVRQTNRQTHFPLSQDTNQIPFSHQKKEEIIQESIDDLPNISSNFSSNISSNITAKPSIQNNIDNLISTQNSPLEKTKVQENFQDQFSLKSPLNKPSLDSNQTSLFPQNNFSSSLISQLDSFKKDLRLKLKKLTSQEMLVYSAIYQFESQGELVDYTLLSSKLNLSQSSMRDYIQKIVSKGLPLDKEKINNKKILLHIPSDFKKLASLQTILTLRDI